MYCHAVGNTRKKAVENQVKPVLTSKAVERCEMKFLKTKVSLAVFCGLFVLSGLALRIRLSPVREHPSAALEDAPPVSLLQPEQRDRKSVV